MSVRSQRGRRDEPGGRALLNSYCDSFGTTTTQSTVQMTAGSTGLFTWWKSYGIQNCSDGTSNTIAFSEMSVGDGTTADLNRATGMFGVALSATAEVLRRLGELARGPGGNAAMQRCL